MAHLRTWRRRVVTAAVLIAVAVLSRFPASAGSTVLGQPGGPAGSRAENVVLITLDGVRTQEIFGGLDLGVLRSTLPADADVEQTRAYKRYGAPTPEASRERLMPFFWTVLMAQRGSIAGNAARGSAVRVTNRHRFSYPGYAELLLGEAHDDVIDSNDKRRNPYPTVLEFLKQRLHLDKGRVAVFASWDTFDWIVEHDEGTITSNAGFDPYEGAGAAVDHVNRLQSEALTPWDAARHDAYTFELAMAHLKQFRPRVLYLAFDETDDWAHDGRYDRVLDTLHATDRYLRELWSVMQQDEAYRDRTAFVITADHGRGSTPADWRDHGSKIGGAEQIWMAFAGPAWPRRGEWRDSATIYQNQVAATLAQALGIDYAEQHPNAGRPITQLLSR
jgi:hypothetical protein